MVERSQLALFPSVRFRVLKPDALSRIAAPDFALYSSSQRFHGLYLEQNDETATYICRPNDEGSIRSDLDALSRLFAFEPYQAIEAFADYISQPKRRVDGLWKKPRRKLALSSVVSKAGHLSSLVPRCRQVCIETAARDHIVHLETIALAEEQEAPTATAVGQMLISGEGLWKIWKSKLLNLLSRFLRDGSTVGSLIFAYAIQTSSS